MEGRLSPLGGGLAATRWGVIMPRENLDGVLPRDDVPIDGDEQIWIGSGDACEIQIRRPGVSEMHCLIQGTGTGVLLADDSPQGTFVNGQKFQRNKKVLRNGDEIKVGGAVFQYRANNSVRRTVSSMDGLSSTPRSSVAAAPGGKEKTLSRYQTLEEVVVRAGFDMDSEHVNNLPAGKEVKVVEERVNKSGTLRIRSKHGWMSVTAKSGKQLMREVKKEKKKKERKLDRQYKSMDGPMHTHSSPGRGSKSMDGPMPSGTQSLADDDDASSESSRSSRSSRSSISSATSRSSARSARSSKATTRNVGLAATRGRGSMSLDDVHRSTDRVAGTVSMDGYGDEEAQLARSSRKSEASKQKHLKSVVVPDRELRRREHKVAPMIAEAQKAVDQYRKMKTAAEGVIAAMESTVDPTKELAGALLHDEGDTSTNGWTPVRVASTFDDLGRITTRFTGRAQEQVVQVAQTAIENLEGIFEDDLEAYTSAREDYDAALGKVQQLEQDTLGDQRAAKRVRSANKDLAAAERTYREMERQLMEQVVEALCAKELHEVEFVKVLVGAQVGRAKATAEVIKRLPGVADEDFEPPPRISRRKAAAAQDDDEEDEDEDEDEDDDDDRPTPSRRRPPSSDEDEDDEELELPDITDEEEESSSPPVRRRPASSDEDEDEDEDEDDEPRRRRPVDSDEDEDSDEAPRRRVVDSDEDEEEEEEDEDEAHERRRRARAAAEDDY